MDQVIVGPLDPLQQLHTAHDEGFLLVAKRNSMGVFFLLVISFGGVVATQRRELPIILPLMILVVSGLSAHSVQLISATHRGVPWIYPHAKRFTPGLYGRWT